MQDSVHRQFLIAVVSAVIFLLCTLYQVLIWQQFKSEYEKTFGIIVKNKMDKEKKYYPVVRFKTLDNQRISFTAPEPSKTKYNEGDTVYVYYDLLNADDAKLAGGENRGVAIFSVLTLLGAAAALYFYRKKQKDLAG
jgi:Protein of unknown function (DUF3592)